MSEWLWVLRKWERGDEEWVNERAKRQGCKDQRAIGEKRMRDFRVFFLKIIFILKFLLEFRPESFWRFRLIRSDLTWIGTNRPDLVRIGAYPETKKKKKKIPTRHQCVGSGVAHRTPHWTRVRHPCSRVSAF